jgi:CubicO group peptidase (beta-lactamase class C family)
VDYVIAGAIAERITGKSWEDLMTTMLFKPLGITDAGFSFSMATGYEVNEPWQHYYSTNGQDIPVPPNYAPDILGLLAPVMYPAGGVHMTILDWAKFINMQLEGENGGSKLLAPETFKILHTQPYNDGYALGWEVENDPVFGTLLTHNGSDGFDYADVWMLPNSNFAVLVTTNAGGNPAFEAGSDAIDTLIGKFLSRPPAGKPTI